jgi:WXXGXW repeat (2 copies)
MEDGMQRFHHLGSMAAIALTALGLSACYPPPPPYYVPPAATATPPYSPTGVAQPYGPTILPGAAPSNAGTTFVSVAPFAPPPPRVETPPPPPSPVAVWEPGHWSWSGGQYVWIAGQYVQRPTPTANWVPGYWQQGPNGWTWTEGRWA